MRHWAPLTIISVVAAGAATRAPDALPLPLPVVVADTKKSLDEFWQRQVANYKSPTDLAPYTPGPLAPCRVDEDRNAYFCPDTGGIYYDAAFLEEYLGEIGQYAPAFILAHEWGHHVQQLLGLKSASVGLWPIQLELQADCFAGQYMRDVTARVGKQAVNQAVVSLFQVGDKGTVPWFDRGAHGRPGQRIDGFNEGLEGRPCAADTFFERLGMDLNSTTQPPTPTKGSLAERLPEEIGRFKRENVKRSQRLIGAGATEMIESVYRSSDGVAVSVIVAAFVDRDQTQAVLDVLAENIGKQGLKESRRTPVVSVSHDPLGTILLFQGATEVVIWNNIQVLGFVEGPHDYAWELATRIL